MRINSVSADLGAKKEEEGREMGVLLRISLEYYPSNCALLKILL